MCKKKVLLCVACLLLLNLGVTQKTPTLRFQQGHAKHLSTIAWSPDGKYIATGSEDAAIIIWDANTGREIKTILGHKATITGLDWSPDGRYLASCALDQGVVVWDWQSGKAEQLYLGHEAGVYDVRWHPSKPMLASGGGDKRIRFWNFKTKQELQGRSFDPAGKMLFGYSSRVVSFDWSPDGEKVVGLSDDNKLIAWDLPQQKTYGKQKIDGDKVYQLRWTPDGKYWIGAKGGSLSMGDADDENLPFSFKAKTGAGLVVWDANTGEVIRRIEADKGFDFASIAISPDSRYVAAAGLLGQPGVWEIETGKKAFDLATGTSVSRVCWSPDGHFIARGRGGLIQIHSATNGRIIHDPPNLRTVDHVTWSPDGRFISGQAYEATKVWNLAHLDLVGHLDQTRGLSWRPGKPSFVVQSVPEEEADTELLFYQCDKGRLTLIKRLPVGKIECFAWSPDGRYLAVGGGTSEKGEVRLFDPEGVLQKSIKGHSDYVRKLAWSPDGQFLATASLMQAQLKQKEDGKFYVVFPDDKEIILVWKVETGAKHRVVQRGTNKTTTFFMGRDGNNTVSEESTGHTKPITGMSWSADGKYLITTSQDGKAKAWDMATGKWKRDFSRHSGIINDLACNPKEEGFATCGMDGTARVWKMNSGQEEKINVGGIPATRVIHERMLRGHTGGVTAVAWSPDGQYLLTGGEDNLVKIWKENKVLVSFVNFAEENEYIAFSPEGYYSSTRKGTDALHYLVEGKVYLFDQFDLRYNRPDKVLATIPGHEPAMVQSFSRAYKKRLDNLGFQETMLSDDFHTPELHLRNRELLPSLTMERKISLEIEAIDTRIPLDRLQVFVNNVPIYGRGGKDLRALNAKKYETTLGVALEPGDNKIEVSVLNQSGAESLRQTAYVTCEREAKPDLYLFGLGVANYQNSKLNLNYPTIDVKEVAALFEKRKGQGFGEVYAETYLDGEVNAEALVKIKDRLASTRVQDEVVIFVAGHGILDRDLKFYLATAQTDFLNPQNKSIAYEQLEALFDGIPARRKLMLIDACHSGELDKSEVVLLKEKRVADGKVKFRAYDEAGVPKILGDGVSSFELMKNWFVDLRRSTGASVISSAAGVEFAIEGEEWQNGIFTYCLLKGIQEKAADLDQDGQIMISELQRYLASEVSTLTESFQRPTFRVENVGYDWPVW